jgi:signal transduction histidine kinase
MFVRYISHEIRTPLNTVSMGLDLILEDTKQLIRNINPSHNISHTNNSSHSIESLSDKSLSGQDSIQTINNSRKACADAVTVLNDLLTFDKLESNTLKLELTTINVLQFLKQTIQPFYVQVGYNI